jgi:hemoglobin
MKHRQVEGISYEMFERWLALFDETARALFEPALAAVFNAKAARIAESLRLAVFYRPDQPWPPTAA